MAVLKRLSDECDSPWFEIKSGGWGPVKPFNDVSINFKSNKITNLETHH